MFEILATYGLSLFMYQTLPLPQKISPTIIQRRRRDRRNGIFIHDGDFERENETIRREDYLYSLNLSYLTMITIICFLVVKLIGRA